MDCRIVAILLGLLFLTNGLFAQEEQPPLFKVTLHSRKALKGEILAHDRNGSLILRDADGVEHHVPLHQVRGVDRIARPRSLKEADRPWMVTLGLGPGTNFRNNLFFTDLSGLYRFRPWLQLGLGGGFYSFHGGNYQLVMPLFTEWRAHWRDNPRMPYTVLRAGVGFGTGYGESLADNGFLETRDYDPGLLVQAMIGWQIGRVGPAPLLLEGGYLGQRLDYTGFMNNWWTWPPQEPESWEVRQFLQRWTLRMAVVF